MSAITITVDGGEVSVRYEEKTSENIEKRLLLHFIKPVISFLCE
ncbi:Uncharacterised protein [Grimontia hollisae]|uniref:Uncharacterized protein n=2 Tax=Grimontia hollisae TaxID=673 RepID=D0I2R7_GRIHO|nr:hypothetical protein VHA_000030 [Grimontia hollisae CIP 101886]STO79477.1 Uncharacterised protein [Grimontia hollisae]STO98971.1 Uncharacterised protein [Grimontia hollisae]STR61847.1 Uncharacterised protein [Grimontia hollisae]